MQPEATPKKKRGPAGIEVRHARTCRAWSGGNCNCTPSYRAWVWDRRSGTRHRKTFAGKGALSAAKGWRSDAQPLVRRNQFQVPTKRMLREVGDEWLEKAKRGEVRSRRKVPFKGSTLRGYEQALNEHVYPVLGDCRLSDIGMGDVQALVDRLNGQGLSGQTVLNAIIPLRVICRYARKREGLIVNPCEDLDLPEPGGRRERVETREGAAVLLDALPKAERALFATAFYGGLRAGELRALRVSNLRGIDGDGVAAIRVEHSWDAVDGEVTPKSRAGVRDVPVPETLRLILADHIARTGRHGSDLVFGETQSSPFVSSTVGRRARCAWAVAAVGAFLTGKPVAIELAPITLHECRHTYSSWLDAAGISETRADRYMGHANGGVAARYRHQVEGQLAEDAKTLERYLSGETNVVYLREAS